MPARALKAPMLTHVLAQKGTSMSTVNANDSNAKAEQPVSHSTVSLTMPNAAVFVQVTAACVYRALVIQKRAKETANIRSKNMAGAAIKKNIAGLFFINTALSTIGAVTTITVIVVTPLPLGNVDSALVTTILVPSTTVPRTNLSMHGICMDAGSIQI